MVWPRGLREWRPAEFRRAVGSRWFPALNGLALLILILSVGLPLAQLLGAPSTWNRLGDAFPAGT